MNQVNQSQLARVWGVTRAYISKLVKKGMPLTSVHAAEQWRALHSKRGFVPETATNLPSERPPKDPTLTPGQDRLWDCLSEVELYAHKARVTPDVFPPGSEEQVKQMFANISEQIERLYDLAGIPK